MPAANVFFTSSGTRCSRRCRIVSREAIAIFLRRDRRARASASARRRRWPYPGLPPIRAGINPGILLAMAEPARREETDVGDVPRPVRDTPMPGAGDSVSALAPRRAPLPHRQAVAPSAAPDPQLARVLDDVPRDRQLPVAAVPRAASTRDAWVEHNARAASTCATRAGSSARSVELQGLFIKVGQLISIMTNFLPEEFRRELEGLQDAVPPRPYEDIEARIREELGKSPDELFAQFERAADRVGVDRPGPHRAPARTARRSRSRSSTPTSRRSCAAICSRCAGSSGSSSWFVPYQGLDELYREIRAIVLEELDYRAEADNAERIAANFEGRTDVALPARRRRAVDRARARHALRGRLQDHRQARRQAARARPRPARAPGRRDLLPADLHRRRLSRRSAPRKPPGPRPASRRRSRRQIVFLDFGAVAEIPGNVRAGIVELIQGALTRDTRSDRRRDEADGLRRARRERARCSSR